MAMLDIEFLDIDPVLARVNSLNELCEAWASPERISVVIFTKNPTEKESVKEVNDINNYNVTTLFKYVKQGRLFYVKDRNKMGGER